MRNRWRSARKGRRSPRPATEARHQLQISRAISKRTTCDPHGLQILASVFHTRRTPRTMAGQSAHPVFMHRHASRPLCSRLLPVAQGHLQGIS